MNKELVFLRTFAVDTAIGFVFMASSAFKNNSNQKFTEIDVERINIVERDGTVKMIITNVAKFPNGNTLINGKSTNENRKKRSGMLFFNKDGIECLYRIKNGTAVLNKNTAIQNIFPEYLSVFRDFFYKISNKM